MSSKNYLDKNGLTYFWGKVQNEINPKANTSDVLTKTNTTSYTPTADYHPATKKYVDDKEFADLSDVFVITCSSDNGIPIIDKTWNEITTAYSNGKLMCCTFDGRTLFFFTNYNSTQDGIINFEFEFGADKVIVWDVAYNQDGYVWEYAVASDVVYITVFNNNGTYSISNTADEILEMIAHLKIVILEYGLDYYYLSNFNNLDILELYFSNYDGTTLNEFIIRDLGNTTTVTYSSQQTQSDWNEDDSSASDYVKNKPSIKAGTGDSAVIINDYYNVPCVASGDGALSEGGATTASGTVSHSEGYVTTAQGNYSHAENQLSLAYGVGSHSEGGTLSGNITISGDANATTYTIVSGCPKIYGTAGDIALYVKLYYNSEYYEPVSVTMSDEVISTITLDSTLDENNALTGASAKLYFRNVAKGKGSHAECGATYAHADYSHSEGKQTHASGTNSHSEGLLTVAASANQHVQGKYNIVDSAGTYAHIVGNGTSSSARSNAHTLDWNGNGWYAGKLTVGAAPTNNMDVATKQYVDTAVSGVSSSLMLTATVNNTTVTFTGATPSEVYTAASGGALVQATIPLVWGDGIFDLKEYNYDSSGGDYYFIFSNVTSDMGRPQNRLVQCSLSTGSATSWTGSLRESCLVGASIFEDVTGVFIDDTTLANNQILRYDTNYGSFVNANTPAIKAGTGENSVIIGTIEDDSSAATYTLYLTGAANSRTYSYTTQDTLPSSIRVGSYVEYTNQYTTYTNSIESIDTTNHSITLMDTFYDALSNAEVKVYYRYVNTAKGNYSLAEGRWTRATQSYSHAEGSSTLAGYGAHSEGSQTSARGMWGHSEGQYTSSRGQASHSEGYGAIAGSDYQHVQGKYNIEDTSDVYAHIVGNGTANSRSNAHTLDWSGNSWYAGKVSAGTVASPASVTNANDLTTKAYVDNALSGVTTNLAGLTDTTVSSPSNGQILIYNSTTSKWENATSPYQTQAQVNALIAAALAEYGDGDTATYGYTDGNEVNY